MVLSVPSKSFLIGEYGVLKGGPALLVNTTPRFELHVRAGLEGHSPFHPESPAGKLYSQNIDTLKKIVFDFHDPHKGRGGLGASSAQFVLLHAFLNQDHTGDGFKMFESYKKISARDQGLPPSGYDVLAQKMGGVTLIEAQYKLCERLDWKLSDIGFFLIRTGHKVATHKHLRNLSELDVTQLSKISEYAIQTYLSGKRDQFLESIKLFRATLAEQNLTAPETDTLLTEFDKNSKILCAKGCGALGADIVVVFFDQSKKVDLRSELSKKFEIVADELQIQPGLQVKEDTLNRGSDLYFEGSLQ